MDKNEFRDKLATGKLTRRAFTKTLGAVGLGMVTMPLIPGMARAGEQALNFTWGGYELPGFYPRYFEKHGTSPDFSLFGDEDEALAKVMAGFRPDLSHPCSPLTKKWRDAGLIQAIDTSRLSDWPDVFPMLKTLDHTQYEGEQWFIDCEINCSTRFCSDLRKGWAIKDFRISFFSSSVKRDSYSGA